jgi:hypothetical protein
MTFPLNEILGHSYVLRACQALNTTARGHQQPQNEAAVAGINCTNPEKSSLKAGRIQTAGC